MNPSVTRVVARRPFSMMMRLRSAARSFEAHPFQRLPVSQQAARGDWGAEMKRVGKQAAIFFPGFAVLLGWPLAAKSIFDGHV
ncbi:hypothetical protein RJ55_03609 [Drechmeria coniospora]|nr:hypothetical protein RJ55_03609 [Drechmeria coniospora]